MNIKFPSTRRQFLQSTAAAGLTLGLPSFARAREDLKPKSVAAVITVYEDGLHADVL